MLIRKLFKAEMAHNVPGAYTERCHYLHGHSYQFEMFFESKTPNSAGMVADFKGIKEMGVNDFLDSFDHSIMVWEKDPVARIAHQVNPNRHIIVPFIPTAEMMAKAFFLVCEAIIKTGPKLSGEKNVEMAQAIVHETSTGYGVYRKEDRAGDQFPEIQFSQWIFSEGIKKSWKTKQWFLEALEFLKGKESSPSD